MSSIALPSLPMLSIGSSLSTGLLNDMLGWVSNQDDMRNLFITNTSASTPDEQVAMSFDYARLWDGGVQRPTVAQDISLTIDITAAGANGLDAGVAATGTHYAIYVISKDWGIEDVGSYNCLATSVAGLFSASFSSPIMPAGYDYVRLVGCCRTDADGDIVGFHQDGYEWWSDCYHLITSGSGVLARTTIDLSSFMPPVCDLAYLWIYTDSSGAGEGGSQIWHTSTATGIDESPWSLSWDDTDKGEQGNINQIYPCEGQQIDLACSQSVATHYYKLYFRGVVFPIWKEI